MSEHFSTALDRLSRVPGVRGAAVVDARTGVPVLGDGAADPALAALATAIYRRAARAGDRAAIGALASLQLEAENGHIVVAGAAETLVVALTDTDAQLGLVRLEARRAAEAMQ